MAGLITGVHLQAERLDSASITEDIGRFANWVVKAKFEDVSTDLEKCVDAARDAKFKPLLNALGFGNKLLYSILHTTNTKYVTGGSNAYLIPIQLEEAANPSISDTTTTTRLELGTIVYIDKPVLVDKEVYFLLITKRHG